MTGELPMQFGDFGEAYLATVSDAVSSYRMRVEEQQQVLQQLQLQRAQQFLNRRPDLAPGHSSNRTSAEGRTGPYSQQDPKGFAQSKIRFIVLLIVH